MHQFDQTNKGLETLGHIVDTASVEAFSRIVPAEWNINLWPRRHNSGHSEEMNRRHLKPIHIDRFATSLYHK